MQLPVESLRRATLGLGIGTLVVGTVPWIAPRPFARAFGLSTGESTVTDLLIRSVSARDAISGIGILSATIHGGRVAPWILARALSDGTDTLAVGIAWKSGARSSGLAALGGIALAANILDVALYLAHKQLARRPLPG